MAVRGVCTGAGRCGDGGACGKTGFGLGPVAPVCLCRAGWWGCSPPPRLSLCSAAWGAHFLCLSSVHEAGLIEGWGGGQSRLTEKACK